MNLTTAELILGARRSREPGKSGAQLMPVRPELRHFYGYHWRHVIRPRILARAHGKCERWFQSPSHRGPRARRFAARAMVSALLAVSVPFS